MAKFKITITIDATYLTDAHAAVAAMNDALKTRNGRVVRVQLARPDTGDEHPIGAVFLERGDHA